MVRPDGAVRVLDFGLVVPNASSCEYDVAPGGQKFLVGSVVHEADTPPVTVVLNWTADLPR